MRRTCVPILCVLSLTCASHSFTPETVHPSPERIAELLALPVPTKPASRKPADLRLHLLPAFAFAGGNVWVICDVPERLGGGTIHYGIEGIRTSAGQIRRIENRLLLERLPCGTWTAFCAVRTAIGGAQQRTVPLDVKGMPCN